MASQTLRTIAGLLTQQRKEKGITQQQLAALLDVPQSYVSKVESGNTDIRTSKLMEIARLLDLEVTFIPKHKLRAVNRVLSGEAEMDERQRYRSAYEPDETEQESDSERFWR